MASRTQAPHLAGPGFYKTMRLLRLVMERVAQGTAASPTALQTYGCSRCFKAFVARLESELDLSGWTPVFAKGRAQLQTPALWALGGRPCPSVPWEARLASQWVL